MKKQNNSNSLFQMAGDEMILPPKNNHQRVIYTLIFPPTELNGFHWWDKYRCTKWSTRLGEIEKKLGVLLVKRDPKEWTDVFGAKTYYTVYTPHLEKKVYIDLYLKLQENNGK